MTDHPIRWLVFVAYSLIITGQAQEEPGRVADTKISIDSGFYSEEIEVRITTATEGAKILYTTDGSEPDPGNLFSGPNGTDYSAPIKISRTTVLRVKGFVPGSDLEPTNVDTRTYLFLDDVIAQPPDIEGWPRPTLSVGQGSGRHDYEMDPRIVGEGMQAEAMKSGLLGIPTMSLVVDPAMMWDAEGNGGFYRGDTEEPVHVEILYPSEPGRRESARGAVQGHSHDRLKRSLRLKFKTEFGDAKFRTELLQRSPHNGAGTPEVFDRLILRAGNNRSWARSWNPDRTAYTMDEWYRATQIAMSGHGSRGAFVHLYMNGLYWGLYNVAERPDRWFTTEHFGGEIEDWFAISHGGDQGGEKNRWNALLADAREDLSDPEGYQTFRAKLDVAGFIDYLLLSWYINVTDWPQNNWWAGMRNTSEGKARFFAWDGEWSFGLGESPGRAWVHPDFQKNNNNRNTPLVRLWNAARENADFMMLVADRAHRHLVASGGALTDPAAQERWRLLNAYIQVPVLAESARWGDALSPDKPRTVEDDWQAEVDRVHGLMKDNGALLIERLMDEDYYPNLDPPTSDSESGFIAAGSLVALSNPNGKGDIYFSMDGSDPRASGGMVSASGAKYETPIQIHESVRISCRVLQQSLFGNQTWSALMERRFYTEIPSLRVSEMMYHPADPVEAEIAAGFTNDDDFEYMELVNIGDANIALEGVLITDGVMLVIGPNTLAPDEHAVVVRNREAFVFRYGVDARILGEYQQGLSNAGERIGITGAFGEPILSFAYDDQWQPTTDGEGHALEVVDLQADESAWGMPKQWRASINVNGTPGQPSRETPHVQELRLLARWKTENSVELEIVGKPMTHYIIESSPDLKVWSEHSRESTDVNGRQALAVTIDREATVYYRARERRP